MDFIIFLHYWLTANPSSIIFFIPFIVYIAWKITWKISKYIPHTYDGGKF